MKYNNFPKKIAAKFSWLGNYISYEKLFSDVTSNSSGNILTISDYFIYRRILRLSIDDFKIREKSPQNITLVPKPTENINKLQSLIISLNNKPSESQLLSILFDQFMEEHSFIPDHYKNCKSISFKEEMPISGIRKPNMNKLNQKQIDFYESLNISPAVVLHSKNLIDGRHRLTATINNDQDIISAIIIS